MVAKAQTNLAREQSLKDALDPPLSESELVVRLRLGDTAAANEFYELYAPRLQRFILHALGNLSADAEDLLQETFMALADALPFFRGESSLFTFACAIAHRKVASFLRNLARRDRLVRARSPQPEMSQTQWADPSSSDYHVAAALAEIKPEYRELLWLKYVEELRVEDIGLAFGLSEHAVESRLTRARKALKRELRGEKSNVPK